LPRLTEIANLKAIVAAGNPEFVLPNQAIADQEITDKELVN